MLHVNVLEGRRHAIYVLHISHSWGLACHAVSAQEIAMFRMFRDDTTNISAMVQHTRDKCRPRELCYSIKTIPCKLSSRLNELVRCHALGVLVSPDTNLPGLRKCAVV